MIAAILLAADIPLVWAGEFRREVKIPIFDAVIGNPPYTRWVEIPERTQNAIRKNLRDAMREYGLKPTPSLCFHCPFYERR